MWGISQRTFLCPVVFAGEGMNSNPWNSEESSLIHRLLKQVNIYSMQKIRQICIRFRTTYETTLLHTSVVYVCILIRRNAVTLIQSYLQHLWQFGSHSFDILLTFFFKPPADVTLVHCALTHCHHKFGLVQKLKCSPRIKYLNVYSEEHKYLNSLQILKFTNIEIMKGSEMFTAGAFPLWETDSKNNVPTMKISDPP